MEPAANGGDMRNVNLPSPCAPDDGGHAADVSKASDSTAAAAAPTAHSPSSPTPSPAGEAVASDGAGARPGRRVSFGGTKVHEFEKSDSELEAEKVWIAEETKRQAEEFEEMKARWAAKAKEKKAVAVTAADVDFRRMRCVRLHRGPRLDALGVDLAVREAPPPGTGTLAVVKAVKRGAEAGVVARAGKGDATLRAGDRIVRLNDEDLAKVEPGRFLAALASPDLVLEVYNELDERADREEAQRAAGRADAMRWQEQAERERRADELREAEDMLVASWLADAKRRAKAARGKRAELASTVDKSLCRTVCIDRRPESRSGDDGLGEGAEDRDEYFKPRESGELLPLGISLFVRANRDARTGEERGTFAVISNVDDDGVVAASGSGHNMIWPDDQIIRLQGRDFRTLSNKEFLDMMNCRRLQLVVCNVDEYAAATRDPDFIDDIGRSLGAAKVRLDAAIDKIDAMANRLKSAWSSKVGELMASSRVSGLLAKVGHHGSDAPAAGAGAAAPAKGVAGELAMPERAPLLQETSPLVEGSSDILRPRHWCSIWGDLPSRIRYKEARLEYSTDTDGYSINYFYATTRDLAPTLLVVKAGGDAVLGAYVTAPFCESEEGHADAAYRGTNEMFVFRASPGAYRAYKWVGVDADITEGLPRMFLNTAKDRFAVGGGGGQHAIELGDNLQHGSTGRCATFGNDPLCEPADFECVALELWAFTDDVDL